MACTGSAVGFAPLCCCRGALLAVLPWSAPGALLAVLLLCCCRGTVFPLECTRSTVGCAPCAGGGERYWLCSLGVHWEHDWLCSLVLCCGGAPLTVLPCEVVGELCSLVMQWEHGWMCSLAWFGSIVGYAPSILPCSVPAVQRDMWEIWRKGKLDN